MPWIVGIDEAGYGPNLGPLVMASVACRVSGDHAPDDLWTLLQPAVQRTRSKNADGILIADSKYVYTPQIGLQELELGVLAAAYSLNGRTNISPPTTLQQFLQSVLCSGMDDLQSECWFQGHTMIPVDNEAGAIAAMAARFSEACSTSGIQWHRSTGVLVCPGKFNALLEQWNTKSVVLHVGLADLLRSMLNGHFECEPVIICVDKHGGRNDYCSKLQSIFPDSMVIVREQGAARSVYEVIGLSHPLEIRFEPRADDRYLCVALASMLAKYVRELLMAEFNQFWRGYLPDLKPTAGYPTDAVRFFEEIAPVAAKLGLAKSALWRHR